MKITEPFFDTSFFHHFPNKIHLGLSELHYEKKVFGDYTRNYEGKYTFYSYILQTKTTINLLYNARPKSIQEKGAIAHHSHLCILESTDGLNFHRPKLNNTPTTDDQSGTNNVIIKGLVADNFPILMDENKMLNGWSYVSIFRNIKNNKHIVEIIGSNNYTKWDNKSQILFDMNDDRILKGFKWRNYFDTLSTIIYNPYTKLYSFYTRYNKAPKIRHVQFSTSTNLLNWSKFQEINIIGYPTYNIYVPTFSLYPDSPYYIGFPPIFANEGDYTSFYTTIMFSKDGLNWNTHNTLKLDNSLIRNIPSHCYATGIAIYNDKFYVYVMHIRKCEIHCYSVPKHRFFYITNDCVDNISLTSKSLKLINKDIHLNFKTYHQGYIIIELLNKHDKSIIDRSEKLSGDHLNHKLKWSIGTSIIMGNEYHINIIMYDKSYIYSISYEIE